MKYSKLEGCLPEFISKAEPALDRMNSDMELKAAEVVCVLVVEGLRKLTTQMAYGSRLLASWVAPEHRDEGARFVQDYYRLANLYAIGHDDALKPNTWTLDSKHLGGGAMDLAPSRDGKTFWWDAPDSVWARMCLIGNSYGLECGLNWPERKKDPGHYELRKAV
jgi:hypothetical protein